MAKYQRTIAGEFDAVVRALHANITSNNGSMTLIDRELSQYGNVRVDVRVYEKSSVVGAGNATLTVVTTGDGTRNHVIAIGDVTRNHVIAIGKSNVSPADRIPQHMDEQLVSVVEHAVNDILAG